jgi:hypothetical protein
MSLFEIGEQDGEILRTNQCIKKPKITMSIITYCIERTF